MNTEVHFILGGWAKFWRIQSNLRRSIKGFSVRLDLTTPASWLLAKCTKRKGLDRAHAQNYLCFLLPLRTREARNQEYQRPRVRLATTRGCHHPPKVVAAKY
jgi:hypothetical protein